MSNFTAISSDELSTIVGGTPPALAAHANAADVAEIKRQAQQYCPVTAGRYANVNPATVTRAQAEQMGNSCVAEINPLLRGVARSRINGAIDHAFAPAPAGH